MQRCQLQQIPTPISTIPFHSRMWQDQNDTQHKTFPLFSKVISWRYSEQTLLLEAFGEFNLRETDFF